MYASNPQYIYKASSTFCIIAETNQKGVGITLSSTVILCTLEDNWCAGHLLSYVNSSYTDGRISQRVLRGQQQECPR